MSGLKYIEGHIFLDDKECIKCESKNISLTDNFLSKSRTGDDPKKEYLCRDCGYTWPYEGLEL